MNTPYPVRIYYEDTDAGGVVYHAKYVHFFERARTEWLRQRGFEQRALAAESMLFAVRRIAVEYKQPAYLDDWLSVLTAPKTVGRTSLIFEQRLLREDAELAVAEVQVVCVGGSPFRARGLPESLVKSLTA